MRARPLALLLALATSSLLARADGPVLHERLAPDAREDLALGRTLSAAPASAGARRDPASASPAGAEPSAPRGASAYGGATSPRGADASYRPDRDTRRPQAVDADDPFSPSVRPFERLVTFDEVRDDGTVGVADARLRAVERGPATDADDRFFAEWSVDRVADAMVRVPTPGPGARLVRVATSPEVPVTLVRDGADNWYVRAPQSGPVRVVAELAVPRAGFEAAHPAPGWGGAARARALPASLQREADEVLAAIGVSRRDEPAQALARLVEYFRGFTPSDAPTPATRDAYLDLALGRRGVCRHRAYAFLVTALGLGLPARMATSATHAWVEVEDASGWHRIDLGGAAAHDDDARALAQAPPTASAPAARAERDDERAAAHIVLTSADADVRHGGAVRVAGSVDAGGEACAGVRLDVALASAARGARERVVASVATDARGSFDATFVVPGDVPVGAYELALSTAGGGACGAGKTPP